MSVSTRVVTYSCVCVCVWRPSTYLAASLDSIPRLPVHPEPHIVLTSIPEPNSCLWNTRTERKLTMVCEVHTHTNTDYKMTVTCAWSAHVCHKQEFSFGKVYTNSWFEIQCYSSDQELSTNCRPTLSLMPA